MGDLRTMVGKMRKRVVLSTITATQETTYGSWVQASATNSTRWASIEPISARDRIVAGQNVSEGTHIVRMRYASAIDQCVTLTYGSRVFEVLAAVNVNELGKVTELICKERL